MALASDGLRWMFGLLLAVLALYFKNEAFTVVNGLVFWMYTTGQGVLQGCPLSGYPPAIRLAIWSIHKLAIAIAKASL